jgi:hypothetical protein
MDRGHAAAAGCCIVPRATRRVSFRGQPCRSAQASIRSSYTPALANAHGGNGHRTAVTKIPAQGNRQGYINNGYRRCP